MRPVGILPPVLVLLLGVGCDSGALAPPGSVEDLDRPSSPVPAYQLAALSVALDDLVERVLPPLGDAEAARSLRPTLEDLSAALVTGNTARLEPALRAAHQRLEQLDGTPALVEEHGADLAAIRLVLEQVAELALPSVPRRNTGGL
jgi:hypothetical protein